MLSLNGISFIGCLLKYCVQSAYNGLVLHQVFPCCRYFRLVTRLLDGNASAHVLRHTLLCVAASCRKTVVVKRPIPQVILNNPIRNYNVLLVNSEQDWKVSGHCSIQVLLSPLEMIFGII